MMTSNDDDSMNECEKWEPGKSIAFKCDSKVKAFKMEALARNTNSSQNKVERCSRYFKRRKDELCRHLSMIRNRNVERCLISSEGRTARPNYGTLVGKSRLTRRIGFTAYAKHSGIVYNPKCLKPALCEAVKQDIKALTAKDPNDNLDAWTKAPALTKRLCNNVKLDDKAEERQPRRFESVFSGHRLHSNSSNKEESNFRSSSASKLISQNSSSDISSRLPDGSNKLLFPRDPPLAEISERILSSLPFLPLRNGDSTTYSRAACNLIGDALKLNGIQLSHDGTAVVSTERSNETENQNICEDVLASFYDQTSLFESNSNSFFLKTNGVDNDSNNGSNLSDDSHFLDEHVFKKDEKVDGLVGDRISGRSIFDEEANLLPESLNVRNKDFFGSFLSLNGLEDSKELMHALDSEQDTFDKPFIDLLSDANDFSEDCSAKDILDEFHGFSSNTSDNTEKE